MKSKWNCRNGRKEPRVGISAKRLSRVSLRVKLAAAMIILTIIPTTVSLLLYYNNSRQFYHDKIETFQMNQLEMMAAQVNETVRQAENVREETLMLAATSYAFEGYDAMTSYERLLLQRNINSQLSTSAINNPVIDHIYLVNYDKNVYSSNQDMDVREFMAHLPLPIDREQAGSAILLPTHEADYKYMGQSKYSPRVFSLLTYLNRFTQSGIVGLIQIDIPYRVLEEDMAYMEMTENDFAFIVNQEGTILYSPESSQSGQKLSAQRIGEWELREIVDSMHGMQMLRQGKYTYRRAEIKDMGWSIIQVNSDMMLKEELKSVRNVWLFTSSGCLFMGIALAFLFSADIMRPLQNVIRSMGRVSKGDFSIRVEDGNNKDIKTLTDGFNRMTGEIELLMKENILKEHERTIVELSALSVKINLHFLYNTLNTIKWLAVKKKQPEIAEMIVSLSSILEYSYKNTDREVTIGEEIQFIGNYIFIHEVRYDGKVEVVYDLEEGISECHVLKMILQPIVENVLIHAFDHTNPHNAIQIKAGFREQDISFVVRDNGKGFCYESIESMTGVGLNNVQQRLLLNYGESYKIEVSSVLGAGTEVCFSIPVH